MYQEKRIAKNTMFLYIRMLLIMGVTLYVSRVVLSVLGVEDFGLYNVVGGVVTMFTFLNGSLGAATSRYITFELGKNSYERLKRIFNAALVVHIFIAILIIILAETIGLWFLYEKLNIPEQRFSAALWVYQLSILTTFFSMTQVPYQATIIAHEDMKIYAYVGLVDAFLRLIIVYLIVYSPIDRLVFYAALLCFLHIGVMIFYRWYCVKRYKESKIDFCFDKSLYKEIFTFSGSDLIGHVAVLAQGQGMNILLNIFFGPVVNAARAIAYQVQGAITQFSNNFMTAVRPQIIKSYAEGNIDDMWRLVIQSSCFSYYLMLFICLPLCLETDTILQLWLGNFPDHSVSFLILIIFLCLIQTLKTPRSIIFHAMAKVFWSNITVGVVLCLAFPLAYVLLRHGGAPESVFWASNITMLLSELVSVIVLRHFLKFSIVGYFIKVHGRCILVTILSGLIPFLIYDLFMEAGFARLLFTCMQTSISVCLISLYVGMDKSMRSKFYKVVKNRFHKH